MYIKCHYCEKTSISLPGLKGHMTKKHGHGAKRQSVKKSRDIDSVETSSKEHELHISNEADIVVDNIISDMINLVDETDDVLLCVDEDSDADSCVTLEEVKKSNVKDKKKYHDNCDECDFEIISARK